LLNKDLNIVLISQARMGSTRFPGKVLEKVGHETLLKVHLDRICRSKLISSFVVATTENPEDKVIEDYVNSLDFKVFRGSETNVLKRYYECAKKYNADYIVRVTSDCPLIDVELIDEVIYNTVSEGADYGSNTLEETFPDGVDVEVFKMDVLNKALLFAVNEKEQEHVTPYMKNRISNQENGFTSYSLTSDLDYGMIRLTVDERSDLEVIKVLIEKVGKYASWKEYSDYYISNHLARINGNIVRNAGY